MIEIPGVHNLELIHESNHSKVYKGEQKGTQKNVIVKQLKAEFPPLKSIAKFNGEYEITHDLDIPAVRKSLEKVKVENHHVLILDFIEGDSLLTFLIDKQSTLSDILKRSITISNVLGDLHSYNIIHKDVNPSNIIIENKSGTVKLIDFGIASQIREFIPKAGNPEVLEGTLPYISPEQTGRTNRSVDYRTDIYSLGITIYQMLTGRLPFEGKDAMEMVHAHIAISPELPHHINPEIPAFLSQIVMKLLEKNPEDRYQSAYGVQKDLEICLEQLKTSENIIPFNLHSDNSYGLFQIPEKLYGREKEIETLLDSFERVSNGNKEFMTIAGYSGIGKTSLVNEVHKPITEKRGYFIKGKFDQFTRDVPFSAVIQALNDLVNQLLSESPEQIEYWKEKILLAIGGNGKVITDVIPNLELIIGPQPEVGELANTEAQNRFQDVFQRFIRAISQADHPLVIFIDDWQWADLGSINFLKILMSDRENKFILLIGAYRDNEVDSTHAFIQTIEALKKNKEIVNEIVLAPIYPFQVVKFVSDTLHCGDEQSWPLAELISNKTQGNPFFIKQFFIELFKEGYISFDTESRKWKWDIVKIKEKGYTDNVIDLMANKIGKFQANTQKVLKIASCIGNEFDLKTLSFLNNKSFKQTLDDLWQALEEGFILSKDSDYLAIDEQTKDDVAITFNFLHDRVQQAAYSLFSEKEQKETSLEIGRMVYETSSESHIDEIITDITNHYNLGIELISDTKEIDLLIRLNLRAGKKAKKATAYQSALNYFNTALSLLGGELWEKNYELALELFKQRGECEYLVGRFDVADKLLNIALEKAKTNMDKASVFFIRSAQLSGQGLYIQAVSEAASALNLFGINIPDVNDLEAQSKAVEKELEQYRENMKSMEIEDLYDLPLMENEDMKVATQIIAMTFDSIVLCPLSETYLPLFATKIVNISIKYGLSDYVPIGYSFIANVWGKRRKYLRCFKFSELAVRLNNDRIPNLRLKCKVNHLFAFFRVLQYPINNGSFRNAFQIGLEVGDHIYAGFACNVAIRYTIPLGLTDTLAQVNEAYLFCEKANYIPMLLHARLCRGYAYALQGESKGEIDMAHDDFVEDDYHEFYADISPMMYAFFINYKLQLRVIFEYYEEAVPLLKQEEEIEKSITPDMDSLFRSEFYFYSGIAIAALYKECSEKDKKENLSLLDHYIEELGFLAEVCPVNFAHMHRILQAEKARVLGEIILAMDLYEEGNLLSQENGFIREEAVTNELAAKFYLGINKTTIARTYMTKAHYSYQVWGATAKVSKLESQYPHLIDSSKTTNYNSTLLSHTTQTSSVSSTTQSGSRLDFQSIAKASLAISGEIKLDVLLGKMMRIAVENAGAQHGLLFLNEKNKLVLQSSYTILNNEVEVLQDIVLKENENLPVSVVNYVLRTKENLVLKNASIEGQFTNSEYIKGNKPKSVLCFPIIKQGVVRAIFYLENNLVAGAFTQDRIEVLNLLSSQIAISIDNALVYNNLENKVAERTTEVLKQKEEISIQNDQLALQAQKLKELDQIKSRFFSNLSHEFRTPLTLIINPVEKLLKDKVQNDDNERDYQNILSNAQRLLRLINQLLDLSKIENDKINLELNNSSINKFLKKITSTFEGIATEREIDLQLIQHENEEDFIIPFDDDSFEKIFYNLLSNAVKFTSKGGKINISLSDEGEFISIRVKDTGSGINPKQLPYIFDRFYQVNESNNDIQEGTGIGLSLVKELVNLHNGHIHVRSQEGEGTEFILKFPKGTLQSDVSEVFDRNTPELSDSLDVEFLLDEEAVISDSGEGINNQTSVLVIEDNKELRNYIVQELKGLYQVMQAENGKKGIEKAFDKVPDLIISDIMMPFIDGYQLSKTLKEDIRTSHIPIILLSAKASFESKIEGLETGADDYISKPFSTKELLLRVKNILNTRKRIKESFEKNMALEEEHNLSSLDTDFISKATQIVEQNLANEELDIEVFCKEIGMSRSNLHRKLKALTDQSATQFIRSIRLQHATKLLKEDEDSIEVIALTVGFSSISYFNSCFKKQFGVSPSRYKIDAKNV